MASSVGWGEGCESRGGHEDEVPCLHRALLEGGPGDGWRDSVFGRDVCS